MTQEMLTEALGQRELTPADWPENGAEEPRISAEAQALAAQVEDLQRQAAALSQAVEQREALLREARADIEEREQRLQELRRTLRERDSEVEHLRKQHSLALERYREALLQTAPEVPGDLVSGETVYELESSLERARELVERIRGRIEERLSVERVPAGAPPRVSPDASRLSPMEKIRLALRRQVP